MTSCCIPQLSFSFYQHRAIRADFSGGQITSDAGLLPLRAFDERHHLTREGAQRQQAGITGDLSTRKIGSNGSMSVEGKGELWYTTRCHL